MEWIEKVLAAPSFWAIFLPAAGATIGFLANERNKLKWEQYQRKELRYQNLLQYLRGFYATSSSKEDKDRFLAELNQCWLYAPDHVIRLAYSFLESVHTSAKMSDDEKEKRLGSLIVAIRRDLLSRSILSTTCLNAEDFKHLKAT